jgi:hypothetical protein
MPFLHFEYYVDYMKMSDVVKRVRDRTERGRSRERRPTWTRMSRRHVSIETLKRYRIDYEFDIDPNYILIKRWVPEYEQDFLWAHTAEIRAKRQRASAIGPELILVRKKDRKRGFKRRLLDEAKGRVKAAARLLGGSASEDSDIDSDCSQTSDESSTSEEADNEIKKILFGSERLATAISILKDRLKGTKEEYESEKKESDVARGDSERPTDGHSLAGSTKESKAELHRVATDLQEHITIISKNRQKKKKAKSLGVDKSADCRSTSAKSLHLTEEFGGGRERQPAHPEISASKPTSTTDPSLNPLDSSSRITSQNRGNSHSDHQPRRSPILTFLGGAARGSRKLLDTSSQEKTVLRRNSVDLEAGTESKVAGGVDEKERDSTVQTRTIPFLQIEAPPVTKSSSAPSSGVPKAQIDTAASENSKTANKEIKLLQIEAPPVRKSVDLLNENLILGYLFPKAGELPYLQPRRTLDQYFYTHLENTSERDSDQVVYRYTQKTTAPPKMFMVDQLWVWILNEGKLLNYKYCLHTWNLKPNQILQIPLLAAAHKDGNPGRKVYSLIRIRRNPWFLCPTTP